MDRRNLSLLRLVIILLVLEPCCFGKSVKSSPSSSMSEGDDSAISNHNSHSVAGGSPAEQARDSRDVQEAAAGSNSYSGDHLHSSEIGVGVNSYKKYEKYGKYDTSNDDLLGPQQQHGAASSDMGYYGPYYYDKAASSSYSDYYGGGYGGSSYGPKVGYSSGDSYYKRNKGYYDRKNIRSRQDVHQQQEPLEQYGSTAPAQVAAAPVASYGYGNQYQSQGVNNHQYHEQLPSQQIHHHQQLPRNPPPPPSGPALPPGGGHGGGGGGPHHHGGPGGNNNDLEYGNQPAESHKQSYGWGGNSKQGSSSSSSSNSVPSYIQGIDNGIGLLALLSLLSLLQPLLLSFTTQSSVTVLNTGRRKRGINDNFVEEEGPHEGAFEKTNAIALKVLPALNVIAKTRQGSLPMDCVYQEVCNMNQVLVTELGYAGKLVGTIVTSGISKLMEGLESASAITNKLSVAGEDGRSHKTCAKLYPICKALEKGGSAAVPLLVEPEKLQQMLKGKRIQVPAEASTTSKPIRAKETKRGRQRLPMTNPRYHKA